MRSNEKELKVFSNSNIKAEWLVLPAFMIYML
jgi:hypothetical protein